MSTLTDIPHIQPGPAWFQRYKPWIQRPVLVPPAMQAVSATGGVVLAPLTFAVSGYALGFTGSALPAIMTAM